MRTALVTGSAGFIGYHLSNRLIDAGWRVVGLDAMTPAFGPELKRERLERLVARGGYVPIEARVEAPGVLAEIFRSEGPEIAVHLAAEAGVRPSIEDPRRYLEANVLGTFELLEAAREAPPAHLLIASTSSAYGAGTDYPYRETMKADQPVSFYAATKRSTEILAHSHAHTYDLPITAFRFFTVYGPWGRPDMATFLFTKAILEGRPIDVYNEGRMARDFVFIDDLVESIVRLIDCVPSAGQPVSDADSLSPAAPFRVVNIGKSSPDELTDFIAAIEKATGRAAEKRLLPMQPGDVPRTWADTTLLKALTGQVPDTPLSVGIPAFVEWYRAHYGL